MLRGLVATIAVMAALVALAITSDTAADPRRASSMAGEDTAAPAAAGDRERLAQVEGRVVDRHGVAVAGATVIARPVGMPVPVGLSTRVFETITDDRGQFRFDGLPPGTYWFVALHGAHPAGASPALPVVDRLEVQLRLDDDPVPA